MTTTKKTDEPKNIEYWVYGLDTSAPEDKQNGYDDLVIAPIPQERLSHLMSGSYVGRIRVHSADTGDDWMVDPASIAWLRIEVRILKGGQVVR